VTWKSVRVANVVRGVVNNFDAREPNHSYDEQPKQNGDDGGQRGAGLTGYRALDVSNGGLRIRHLRFPTDGWS
jgi:hypothetical protein